jgi:anti-anti-sigma regulatory factor
MDALTAGRLDADKIETTWHGAVTSHETPALREQLFSLLDSAGGTSLRVDVRGVTAIDRSGIAVLIGARRRAAATGRTFVLIDSGGPVSTELRRMHVLDSFLVTQVVPADRNLAGTARVASRG